jgi:hypothetical protein
MFVPLRMTLGIAGIHLKPVCGKDEIVVEDISTRTALALLDGLVIPQPGEGRPDKFSAASITTADRDRILAWLYISIYGPKIESTITCEACEQPFDLDFLLTDLLSYYRLEPGTRSEDDTYQIETGSVFRLPTGEDELMLAEVAETDAESFLMTRCLLKGEPEKDRANVLAKMEEIAPVLNIEMEATCPECGHVHQVQFDIQSFLLTRLKQQRPHLIQEIHSIAMNYHWSQESILALPRTLRTQYASLIEAEV